MFRSMFVFIFLTTFFLAQVNTSAQERQAEPQVYRAVKSDTDWQIKKPMYGFEATVPSDWKTYRTDDTGSTFRTSIW